MTLAASAAASLAAGSGGDGASPPFGQLLYVARNLGSPDTMRFDLPQATTWGSNLYRRDLATGISTPLLTAGNLPSGVTPAQIDVQSPDLSYDATRVVFSARLGAGKGWDLYELHLGTLELHSITGGTLLEDELMPHYLPDGDLVFCSNRHRGYDEYEALFVPADWALHNAAVALYRCRPDGSGLVRLSMNQSHDLSPSVLKNGKVLHSSWLKQGESRRETRFPAWTILPDGSESFPLFGDHGIFAGLIDLAELPDGRIVGVNAFFKSGFGGGSLVVMRPHPNDFENDYVVITPEVPLEEESAFGRYRSPRPAPGGGLVVAWSPTGTWDTAPPQFGLYRMTLDGTGKELLVDDPGIDEIEGIPIVPYSAIHGAAKPATLPGPRNPTYASTAIVMSRDARFGDIPLRSIRKKASAFSPSEVVAIRVLAGSGNRTLDHTNLLRYEPETILGEVPLESDGSFKIEVPAGVPYHLQGIDERGLALVHETAWQFEPPGKSITCGGCHAHQSGPSPNVNPIAASKPPVFVGKGSPTYREIEFVRDVLPILEAKCAGCHHAPGAQPPAGGLDLETDPYAALQVDKSGVTFGDDTFIYVDEGPVARRYLTPGSANESLLVWKIFGARLDGRLGSDLSVDVDPSGEQMPPPGSGVTLTDAERRLIVQWVDAGAQRSLGTIPAATLPDTDGDGIRDAYFVSEQYAMTGALDPWPTKIDGDGDGVSDVAEDINGNGLVDAGESDPRAWDSDADGVPDGMEKSLQSDPVDPASLPLVVQAVRGNVNAGVGKIAPILYVNNSTGDALGLVSLTASTPLTVQLLDPPAGPSAASSVVFLASGGPQTSEVTTLPFDLGLMAFPPETFVALPSSGSVFVNAPAGWGKAADVTIQALMLDAGSASGLGVSVTNAVHVVIAP